MNTTRYLLIVSIAAAGALAIQAAASPAAAAVRWTVNGQSGEACSNASAAWALFNAAKESGIQSAQITPVNPADPLAVKCEQERKARAEARKAEQS